MSCPLFFIFFYSSILYCSAQFCVWCFRRLCHLSQPVEAFGALCLTTQRKSITLGFFLSFYFFGNIVKYLFVGMNIHVSTVNQTTLYM